MRLSMMRRIEECIESHGGHLSTYNKRTLSAITHELNVSGHMLIWIFFLVLVNGPRAQGVSAPFSYTLSTPYSQFHRGSSPYHTSRYTLTRTATAYYPFCLCNQSSFIGIASLHTTTILTWSFLCFLAFILYAEDGLSQKNYPYEESCHWIR
jgi:hypothetical protein